VIFVGIAAVIGLALLIAPFIVAYQQPDPEKLSAYECDSMPSMTPRMKFTCGSIWFAILFIISTLKWRSCFPGRSLSAASAPPVLVDDGFLGC